MAKSSQKLDSGGICFNFTIQLKNELSTFIEKLTDLPNSEKLVEYLRCLETQCLLEIDLLEEDVIKLSLLQKKCAFFPTFNKKQKNSLLCSASKFSKIRQEIMRRKLEKIKEEKILTIDQDIELTVENDYEIKQLEKSSEILKGFSISEIQQ